MMPLHPCLRAAALLADLFEALAHCFFTQQRHHHRDNRENCR